MLLLLQLFFPCRAPLGSVSEVATPSSRLLVSAGRLKRTQCVQMPRGASGSSQMRAKLFVPWGVPFHCKDGETSAPSPVYILGMASLSSKAELVSCMLAAPS